MGFKQVQESFVKGFKFCQNYRWNLTMWPTYFQIELEHESMVLPHFK
jgi:hypothetical protein